MTKTHKTDLKFFTNLPNETLLDRFVKTIEHAKFFDVLVGYFRISGFNKLANSLGKTEQIRILVGLNTDRRSYELIQFSKGQQSLQLESIRKSRDIFAEALAKEIESDENESEVEKAAIFCWTYLAWWCGKPNTFSKRICFQKRLKGR